MGRPLRARPAQGGAAGKIQCDRFARGRSQLVRRRIAQHMRAVAVREKQAAIGRKNLLRHIGQCGKKQLVTMLAVVGPFAIDAKILNR